MGRGRTRHHRRSLSKSRKGFFNCEEGENTIDLVKRPKHHMFAHFPTCFFFFNEVKQNFLQYETTKRDETKREKTNPYTPRTYHTPLALHADRAATRMRAFPIWTAIAMASTIPRRSVSWSTTHGPPVLG